MNRQIQALRGGAQVVIGTPGRVIDLMQRGELHLDGVTISVLDEGDRMFDMGFKDDIEYILSTTPKEKQSMLFSATVPTEIQYLIERNFRNPKEVRIGDTSTDVTQVEQVYVDCDFKQRFNKLCNFLVQEQITQAIIFCNAKHECEKLARNLKRYEFKTMSLHGDLSQNQRDDAMDAFKDGKIQILCATDLAARGLDIDGVSHVINYDVPKETNNYVHRIGRTARAGRTGVAITFLLPEGWEFFRRITQDLKVEIKPIDVPVQREYWFRRDSEGGPRGPYRGGPQRRGPSRTGQRSFGSSSNSTRTSSNFERNRHYLGL
jgi:ATP-dependent RNA helicase DeaD